MFGSACLLVHISNQLSVEVAIATQRLVVLGVLNLERVMWQGGLSAETHCAQLRCAPLRQWAWVP
jgi:hypothetical protein